MCGYFGMGQNVHGELVRGANIKCCSAGAPSYLTVGMFWGKYSLIKRSAFYGLESTIRSVWPFIWPSIPPVQPDEGWSLYLRGLMLIYERGDRRRREGFGMTCSVLLVNRQAVTHRDKTNQIPTPHPLLIRLCKATP